jgi:actin-related protein
VVPIYEGYALPHAISSIPVGGNTITNFLIESLENRGIELPSTKVYEVA